MTKGRVKINEHFVILEDEYGNRKEVIYNPPLLAKVGNLRVELRKEMNHSKPHVHIIKKCGNYEYDLSLALDDLEILAGVHNCKHFDKREYQQTLEFILENQELIVSLYKRLRGNI